MLLHEIHSSGQKRWHFDLCNFRHFVPGWCTYSNQPKGTLFDLFWRCWQNWKGSTMITLIHLIYFDVLFIGHFFNLKFWTNLQALTYVISFFQTCILVFLWWQKVKKTCFSTSVMFHCNVKMSGIKKDTPSNDIVVTKWRSLGITVPLLRTFGRNYSSRWMRLFLGLQ